MKKCSAVMEKYLGLDKGESVPLFMTLHLLLCENCRSEVRFLKKAESAATKSFGEDVLVNDDSISAVMKKIYASDESMENPISLPKWILGGIAMLLLFVVFAIFSRKIESAALKICVSMEFAAMITIYCALFIRGNIDFFVKLINTKIGDKQPNCKADSFWK